MKRKHIILAIESKQNMLPLSLLLESYNFRVTTVKGVDQIIKKICFHRNSPDSFDLLITDTLMADHSLKKLLIRLQKLNINLPYILISDTNRTELLIQLLEMGFYGYLVKPYDPVILVERVINILENVKKYQKNAK